jgi:hypothetical protein
LLNGSFCARSGLGSKIAKAAARIANRLAEENGADLIVPSTDLEVVSG